MSLLLLLPLALGLLRATVASLDALQLGAMAFTRALIACAHGLIARISANMGRGPGPTGGQGAIGGLTAGGGDDLASSSAAGSEEAAAAMSDTGMLGGLDVAVGAAGGAPTGLPWPLEDLVLQLAHPLLDVFSYLLDLTEDLLIYPAVVQVGAFDSTAPGQLGRWRAGGITAGGQLGRWGQLRVTSAAAFITGAPVHLVFIKSRS